MRAISSVKDRSTGTADTGTVLALTKQDQIRMAAESGVQSSMDDNDIKSYLREVIGEIEANKTQHETSQNK